MSSIDSFSTAFEGIRKSLADGRFAHGFLVVGSPRGAGSLFAQSLTQLLFCTELTKPCGTCAACKHIEQRQHADVLWIEPESKGRVIKVETQVRPLIQQFSQKAFGGGWKAGIILQADRMSDGSANALLKTLEEPPPRTVLILVTDSPQSMLPTILSRCQRIMLSEAAGALGSSAWRQPLVDLLSAPTPDGPVDALARASAIKGLLDIERERLGETGDTEEDDEDVTKEVEAARAQAQLLQIRAELLQTLLLWQRDILCLVSGGGEEVVHFKDRLESLKKQAAAAPYGVARKRVVAAENLIRRLERNVPELPSLEGFMLEAFVSNAR